MELISTSRSSSRHWVSFRTAKVVENYNIQVVKNQKQVPQMRYSSGFRRIPVF